MLSEAAVAGDLLVCSSSIDSSCSWPSRSVDDVDGGASVFPIVWPSFFFGCFLAWRPRVETSAAGARCGFLYRLVLANRTNQLNKILALNERANSIRRFSPTNETQQQ